MIHWNVKRVYQAGNVIIAVMLVGSVFIGLKALNDFQVIDQSWNSYIDEAAKRSELLSEMKSHLGYGGFIHHFKNYVIRKDDTYYSAAKQSIQKAKNTIKQFNALFKKEEDIKKLNELETTINIYEEMLNKVKTSITHINSTDKIDELVKVDDRAAFNALRELSKGTHDIVKNYQIEIAHSIKNGKIIVIIGLVGIALLLVSSLLLIKIVKRLSDEAGEANRRLYHTVEEVNGFKKLLDEHALVSMTDIGGKITYANEKFCQVSGFSRDELIGKKHSVVRSNKHTQTFWKKLWKDISKGNVWHGEVTNRRKDGSLYWVYSTIMPFKNEKGRINRYISARTDITDIKKAEQRIHQLAYIDQLTGLPNLTQFNETLEGVRKEIDGDADFGRLIVLDIGVDGLIEINGTFGWEYGDKLIKAISERLNNIDLHCETIAKIGGDRFGLLLLNNKDEADFIKLLKEHIISSFIIPISVEDNFVKVNVSCGAIVYPDDLENIDCEHQSASDINRYLELCRVEAQKRHGNTLTRFNSSLLQQVSNKTLILQGVEKAIRANELYMVYQPQISLKTGQMIGVEALMRWKRLDGSHVSPGDFIPVLEVSEQITDVSIWANKQCFSALKLIHQVIPTCRMGINISANFLTSEYFIPSIQSCLSEYNVKPSLIEMEVTESAIMDDLDFALSQLQKLKDLGYRISIDDFGTGHSSLAYLVKFPVDQLKIDKSFVRHISESDHSLTIARTIISLGKSMKFDVIAEGAETKEQVEILKRENCDEVQGFYFAKPMELEELLNWYKANQ